MKTWKTWLTQLVVFAIWSATVLSAEPVLRAPSGLSSPGEIVDLDGEPLPAGAKLRLGTIRLQHPNGVRSVAFSPDGKLLATCGGELIHFWDIESGKLVHSIMSKIDEGNTALVFAPDGSSLAAVDDRGHLRVWKMPSGELLFENLAHFEKSYGQHAYGVAFAPDGRSLATAGGDARVRLWDVATGGERQELKVSSKGDSATAVAYSPSGRRLAAGTQSGNVLVWDLETGAEPIIITGAHEHGVTSLAFGGDGLQLFSSGARFERTDERIARSCPEVKVWDAASGKSGIGFELKGLLDGECTLVLSKDRTLLAVGCYEKIIVWDLASQRIKQILFQPKRHFGGLSQGMAISPDNRWLASGAFAVGPNDACLWELETGKRQFARDDAHCGPILAIDFSPDRSQVVTGSADGKVRLWDASTGEHIRLIDEGTGWVRYVQFTPDGQQIALGRETHSAGEIGFEGEVKICKSSTGELLHHWPVSDRVMAGDMTQDGKRIVAAIGLGGPFFGPEEQSEPKVIVIDKQSKNAPQEFAGLAGRALDLRIDDEGEHASLFSEDQRLRQWDVTNGQLLQNLNFGPGQRTSRFHRGVIFPTNERILLGGLKRIARRESNGQLEVRSFDNLEPVWTKSFPDRWPWELAVSPDGNLVAGAMKLLSNADPPEKARIQLTLFSAADGREVHSWKLPQEDVRSVAFSRDGRMLATGMGTGDTLLWDVPELDSP